MNSIRYQYIAEDALTFWCCAEQRARHLTLDLWAATPARARAAEKRRTSVSHMSEALEISYRS